MEGEEGRGREKKGEEGKRRERWKGESERGMEGGWERANHRAGEQLSKIEGEQ